MAKTYVDNFLIAVPKKNLKRYLKLARLAAKVWTDHGALDYFEALAEDLTHSVGKTTYQQAVGLKKGEVIISSVITYKSRKHRDLVLKRVFADQRMNGMMEETKEIMDADRMLYGGFDVMLRATAKRASKR